MLTRRQIPLFPSPILFAVVFCLLYCSAGLVGQDTPQSQSGDVAKVVGAIQSITGNTIVLKKDDGAESTVTVEPGARLARVALGQKDLKSATAIQLRELQVGDRVLVRGKAGPDGKSLTATIVLAMKKADVEAKQQSDRQDWQRRGVSGVVTSVDSGAGTIAISTATFREKKTITIHTTPTTAVRRYAPDSVKFDDAKIGTLAEIKPGDQLRARGTRSPDGSELSADEIVSGSFRNISGTISSTDPSANTVTVVDFTTKKPVIVKITNESEVRKLPPEIAQRIAMRLKGTNGASGAQTASTSGSANGARPEGSAQNYGEHTGAMGAGSRPGGQPDFQQLLNRLPPAGVVDFQKGEAVMIVSTEGTGSGEVTAITLLGGVEPILASSPNGSEPMRLSPWTLGSGDGEEAAQ
jgi:uncharacterized protein DUF5666